VPPYSEVVNSLPFNIAAYSIPKAIPSGVLDVIVYPLIVAL
jgi:hypothetical protein